MNRTVLAAVALTAFGWSASACADEEQYSVPGKLCGIEMDATIVRSVLPQGSNLTQHEFPPQKRFFCDVTTNNHQKEDLQILVSRHPDRLSNPIWEDNVPPEFTFRDMRPSDLGDRAAIGSESAIADVRCMGGRVKEDKYLTVRMSLPWLLRDENDGKVSRPEIEKFLDAYLKGQMRNHSC
ncbi:hypothetical protein [Streptomyces boninensis]|uniref:hypothetical protein n=1 Tax=Streptomyces boninensis TaxID=2039455 RepID=UPI003B20CB4D